MLIVCRTYEILNGMPAEARDEGWETMTTTAGWLFSRTLDATDWAGLKIVAID
jgi:hypothetical protein